MIFDSEFHGPRRRFVKWFALLSASSLMGDRRWHAWLVGEVAAVPAQQPAVLQIRVADYPALNQDYGSVRIGTSSIQGNHFPRGLFYPVIVNRAPENQFYALDAQCTHAGCTVPTLHATAREIRCPCHGSRFGVEGRLLAGPAGFPLRQFKSTLDAQGLLTIEFPPADVQGLDSFFAAVSKVEANTGRAELRFLAFENIRYELKARASLRDPWQNVPFATTPNGPLDQTVFNGRDDYAQLYVAAESGMAFFAVVMQTREV